MRFHIYLIFLQHFALYRYTSTHGDGRKVCDGAQRQHVSCGVQCTFRDRLLLVAAPKRHCNPGDGSGQYCGR